MTAEPNLRVSFAPCGALTRHVWAFVLEARAGRMEGEEAEERKGGSMQERELCTQNKSSGIWTVGLPRVFVHFLPPHFPLTLLKKREKKKTKNLSAAAANVKDVFFHWMRSEPAPPPPPTQNDVLSSRKSDGGGSVAVCCR